MSKKILLVSRHAPYGSSTARDALDAALAASVYEQDLGILFMDDGVFQLLPAQDSNGIQQKNLASMLQVLPLYGIENIYVHSESLEQRKITESDLIVGQATFINSGDIGKLFARQDQLLSF